MKYTIHYDGVNLQWNCFELLRGYEIFICSFKTLAEAQAWCKAQVVSAEVG